MIDLQTQQIALEHSSITAFTESRYSFFSWWSAEVVKNQSAVIQDSPINC